VNREQVIETLMGNGAQRDKASLYADAYLTYHEANKHILEFGALQTHPRTGVPFHNPYLAIREKAMAQLLKFKLNTKGLW
jgi:phage terminase small subunit